MKRFKVSLEAIVPVYLLVLFATYFFDINPQYSNVLLVGISSCGYLNAFSNRTIDKSTFFYLCLILLTGVISMSAHDNLSIGAFVKSILYLGIVMVMMKGDPKTSCYRILFILVSSYFIFQMINGTPHDEVLKNKIVSRNFISVIILTSTILLYFSIYRSNNKIPIIPALISFVISIYGRGRSGIISSFLLLFGMVILKLFHKIICKKKYLKLDQRKENLKILLNITVIFVAIFIIIILTIPSGNISIGNFKNKGLENYARRTLWLDYLRVSISSVKNFVLAPELNAIPSAIKYGGNLHNSYLQIYASYGILFLFANIILILKSMYYYMINNNYVLALLFIVVLIRASADMLFFPGYGEIIFMLFVLYPFFEKSQTYEPFPYKKNC